VKLPARGAFDTCVCWKRTENLRGGDLKLKGAMKGVRAQGEEIGRGVERVTRICLAGSEHYSEGRRERPGISGRGIEQQKKQEEGGKRTGIPEARIKGLQLWYLMVKSRPRVLSGQKDNEVIEEKGAPTRSLV